MLWCQKGDAGYRDMGLRRDLPSLALHAGFLKSCSIRACMGIELLGLMPSRFVVLMCVFPEFTWASRATIFPLILLEEQQVQLVLK